MPPFLKIFLFDSLNSEQKPSVKNQSTGPVRNLLTGRSTGVDFEIYRSGRVEKILTGSISALDSQNSAYRPRIREQELFFRNFCELTRKLRIYFGTKTFFFVFTWKPEL